MSVVADVIATFRGDTTDLEASANRANAAVAGIGDSTSSIAPAFADGTKAASDLAEKVSAGSTAIDEMGEVGSKAMGSFRNAIVPIIGAAGLGGLIDMARNTTMEMQTLGVQFNAAFGGAGGAALKESISDADKYGVSITAAGSAYAGLGLVTKGTSSQIQSDMKAAADGAAGLGLSIDSVSGMLTNYYQLVQRVGGTGSTANRAATSLLTSNLIDPATANELRLQGNQGASAQSLLGDITGNIESRFPGAGKAQANTFGGQIQTFKNQFSEADAGALSPITSGLQSGLTDINKGMQTTQFKQATQDITGFVGAMAHGVEIIGPFAKTIAEVVLDVAGLASHIPLLATGLGVVLAAFLAMQAINIASSLIKAAQAMGSMASGEQQLSSATMATNASLAEQVALLTQINAAGMTGGLGLGATNALGGVGTNAYGPEVPAAESPSMLSRAGSFVTSRTGLMGMAGAGLIGSQLIGNAVGGSTGSAVSTIGGMAGTGALVGSFAGPEGTVAGAGIGAAAGIIVNAFHEAAASTQAFNTAVTSATTSFSTDHPVNNLSSANAAVRAAHGNVSSASSTGEHMLELQKMGFKFSGDTSQMTAAAAGPKELTSAEAERSQVLKNLETIATSAHISDPQKYASTNNIDLTGPTSETVLAIKNLGGAAQETAEKISSAYTYAASQISGQYGEQTPNTGSLIGKTGGSGVSKGMSQTQFFDLAKQAGIDLNTMGITPQSINSTSVALPGGGSAQEITPQEAQLKNQQLSVTLQYNQALQGEQEAAFAAGQAEFSLSQAYFSQSQAVFSAEQAMFSYGRAILTNTVAQVSQASATSATSTALTSGYLPANANVAASLAQITSLSAGQVTAINAEVSSYNTLENAMYGAVAGGQSLFAQYTQLNGAVQTLQAQTQQYQQLLNEPLDGSKEYSAAQEQYKVQEAAVQQQIDTLELSRVPTDDPRVKTLQAQLTLLQTQADLSTQINTQGVGQQQFQIQQAQLGPSQSDATQMGAAQAMGQLDTQLLAAQQALDPVNASYVALNAQLTIAQQRNSAVTGALSTQASADQGVITANNGVVTAANGVVSANNGVVTAANAVKTAQEGVETAEWAVNAAGIAAQQAVNTFASALPGNISTALTDIQQFVTSIGSNLGDMLKGVSQSATFAGEAAAAGLAGNTQLAAEYNQLITMIAQTGKSVSQQTINAVVSPGLSSLGASSGLLGNPGPLLASGGVVQAGGTAQVHGGEVIVPAQLAYLVALLGGGQAQQWVAAALHNGIETGASSDIHELAGGIGPAAGIFQFEPATWLGNGGGAFAGTQPNGMSGASVATATQQAEVFINATGGRGGTNFGDWGPDFGTSYGARTWPPVHGSHVANMIDSMFGQHFANGGFVPGMGPVNATLHGGEFVVSNAMLAQLNGSGVGGSGGKGGLSITMGPGAIAVDISVSGASSDSQAGVIAEEVGNAIEDAFTQLMQKWGSN